MASIEYTQSGPKDGGNFECKWAGDYVAAHLLSDVGKKREKNEDSCGLCAPVDPGVARHSGILLTVADGMGGVRGGGFASSAAIEAIISAYFGTGSGTIPERLRHAVERANERIFDEADDNPDYYGMGTTVSALLIQGQYAYIAHVGDSRVYLRRDGLPPWQVTQDHSLVAEQVRNGLISEEQARTHVHKNVITRAVGTKPDVLVDLSAVRLKRGDTFLICSDGLSNVVEDRQIGIAMQADELDDAGHALIDQALKGGGPDNITAVLVRITGHPPHSELQAGAQLVCPARPGLLGRLGRLFG